MTWLDDKMLPKAREVIARVGVTVTLRRNVTTPSATGTASVAPTDHSVTTSPLMRERQTLAAENVANVNAGLLRRERSVVYLAGQGAPATPERGDNILGFGKVWFVEEVVPFRSGNSVAAWKLVLV